jgi:hypothetical protein
MAPGQIYPKLCHSAATAPKKQLMMSSHAVMDRAWHTRNSKHASAIYIYVRLLLPSTDKHWQAHTLNDSSSWFEDMHLRCTVQQDCSP